MNPELAQLVAALRAGSREAIGQKTGPEAAKVCVNVQAADVLQLCDAIDPPPKAKPEK